MTKDTIVNDWMFNGEPLLEAPDGMAGFVYLLTNKETGKKYIGRKYFNSIRKVKGKRNRVRKESDWREYYSSSKIIKEEVELDGIDTFTKEILVICKTRGDVNHVEIEMLWKHNVLEDSNFYNESIGARRRIPEHTVEARIYNDKQDV